jgi:signal transduction histidine kinase
MTVVMLHNPGYPRVMHLNAYEHGVPLTVLAAICMAGGLWYVKRALSPISQLRLRLGDVRDGRTRRLEGRYPSEVQPLVDDLNGLLDQRERAIERAVAKAGDLAHGLKTPLALLAQEAERAAATGQRELGAAIAQHVDRMRRQTDYHLAQARAAASGASSGAQCVVAASVEGLARTLQRLYAERGIRIDERVPAAHTVRCQREDLDEMLGNLLDNACKWARSQVAVESNARDGIVEIAVDDDGAGLPAAMRDAVLQRGVRADEAAPGTGLGLAIVRDLAELYGGSISLDDSPLNGLRARLTLPRGADSL